MSQFYRKVNKNSKKKVIFRADNYIYTLSYENVSLFRKFFKKIRTTKK